MTCTFRIGTAGSPSDGDAMAGHLLEATLTRNQALELCSYLQSTLPAPGEATCAEPRPDLDIRLSDLFSLDPAVAPTRNEVASLLSGHRADRLPIPGRQLQRATLSLAERLRLPVDTVPTAGQIKTVMAGRRADGGPCLEAEPGRAIRQFLDLYGVPTTRDATPAEIEQIRAGRRADGGIIGRASLIERLNAKRSPVAYIDFTFSADKSVSVALALAPTTAERAIIVQAHRDAVRAALGHAESLIGRARKGRGGKKGVAAGQIAWLTFDHFVARATRLTGRDALGSVDRRPVDGDPQLHTHCAILNAVVTDEGRVAALDTGNLRGRLHEIGALYHAVLATRLRCAGVATVLDRETGSARILGVPEWVRQLFSKRTRLGEVAARNYARKTGLVFSTLSSDRRVGLMKQGVQGDPAQTRRDDLSNEASWRSQAGQAGYVHRTVVNFRRQVLLPSRETRFEQAANVAWELLDRQCASGERPAAGDVRVAAMRGLIEAGIECAADGQEVLDRITSSIRRYVVNGVKFFCWTRPNDRGGEQVRWIPVEDVLGGDSDQANANDLAATRRSAMTTARSEMEARRCYREGDIPTALQVWREDGKARLLEGDNSQVIAAIAAVWTERHAANRDDPTYILELRAPTHCDAVTIGKAIRRHRQQLGDVGPDLVTREAEDPSGVPFELVLGKGDRVRLVSRVNAACTDKRRGVLGGPDAVLVVCDADYEGARLRSASGREGLVRWTTLQGPNGRVRLTYADVAVWDDPFQACTEQLLAMPAGMAGLDMSRLRLRPRAQEATYLLCSDTVERRRIATATGRLMESLTEMEVWECIAAELAGPVKLPGLEAVLASARETRLDAIRAVQRMRQQTEQRAVDGLRPATLKGAVRRSGIKRQLSQTLQEVQPDLVSFQAKLLQITDRVLPVLAIRATENAQKMAGHASGGQAVVRHPLDFDSIQSVALQRLLHQANANRAEATKVLAVVANAIRLPSREGDVPFGLRRAWRIKRRRAKVRKLLTRLKMILNTSGTALQQLRLNLETMARNMSKAVSPRLSPGEAKSRPTPDSVTGLNPDPTGQVSSIRSAHFPPVTSAPVEAERSEQSPAVNSRLPTGSTSGQGDSASRNAHAPPQDQSAIGAGNAATKRPAQDEGIIARPRLDTEQASPFLEGWGQMDRDAPKNRLPKRQHARKRDDQGL